MRESPRRSHASLPLVALALLALGACAPQFDLSNSPPPCSHGYALCPMTGACQPIDPNAPAPPAMTVDAGDGGVDPNAPPPPTLNCLGTLELRQGGSAFLSAPGAQLGNLDVESIAGDKLIATKGTDDFGRVGVWVKAMHGALAGDAFGSTTRIVTITTRLGGDAPFVRKVPVIVSYITAARGGDDSLGSPGTFGHPFATLQNAVAWAAPTDTIILRSIAKPKDDTRPDPGDDPTPVSLPDKITLKAVDDSPAALEMPIVLQGDASLELLRFDGPRLRITKPGSHVSFVNDILTHGLTVDGLAGVAPKAPGTVVTISDRTVVFDDRPPNATPLNPLDIAANGAEVTIDGSYINMTDNTAPVESIGLSGNDQSLTLSGGTEITNTAGNPALHVTKAAVVSIMRAKFFADLLVENADTDVTAASVTFDRAALTFRGHNLTLLDDSRFTDYDAKFTRSPLTFQGSELQMFDTTIDAHDLALPASQDAVQIAASSDARLEAVTFKNAPVTFSGGVLDISGATTTFSNSLLTFAGASLTATDAAFSGQGIIQAPPNSISSVATLQNVTISNYTQFGYRLRGGTVAIARSTFTHDSSVTASADGTAPPWALRIDAESDSGSSLTSQATFYDGVKFMPAKCDFLEGMYCGVLGPSVNGSVFSISPALKAEFSQ